MLKARPRISTHSCNAIHLRSALGTLTAAEKLAQPRFKRHDFFSEKVKTRGRAHTRDSPSLQSLHKSKKQEARSLQSLYITSIQLNHHAFLSCPSDPVPRCTRQCSHIQYALPTLTTRNISQHLTRRPLTIPVNPLGIDVTTEDQLKLRDPSIEQSCYWDGTSPFCAGGCPSGYSDCATNGCGDGACCVTGYKKYCCRGGCSRRAQGTNST